MDFSFPVAGENAKIVEYLIPAEYVALLASITLSDGDRAARQAHQTAVLTLRRAGFPAADNIAVPDGDKWIARAVTSLLNKRPEA